jgi:galactokinase
VTRGDSARIFVPGRIEVLGKHTDYAGGSSLLVAVDRGLTFTAEPGEPGWMDVTAADTGETLRLPVARGARPGDGRGGEARPGWAPYVEAVVARLRTELAALPAGDPAGLPAARIAFRSTLPVAAGLSSSSALVTGTFLALDALVGIRSRPGFRRDVPDREALAAWLADVEAGREVGTRGGSEDHVAILCGRPHRVVRYAFAPVRPRGGAPVPEGWTFAVGSTGVVAEKAGSARNRFNRLSDLAAEAARAWSAASEAADPGETARGGGVTLGAALEAAGPEGLVDGVRDGAARLGIDPEPLVRRARHFAVESACVEAAFLALQRGDVPALGAAATRSTEAAAELLGNQVPETLALVDLARELGAGAASPFGAGFGGSVWALVADADADAFLDAWRKRYAESFPHRSSAEFFVTAAAASASVTPTPRPSARPSDAGGTP